MTETSRRYASTVAAFLKVSRIHSDSVTLLAFAAFSNNFTSCILQSHRNDLGFRPLPLPVAGVRVSFGLGLVFPMINSFSVVLND